MTAIYPLHSPSIAPLCLPRIASYLLIPFNRVKMLSQRISEL